MSQLFRRLLPLALLALLLSVPLAHAYQSVEWTDTGEFEFESDDELWTALRYWAQKFLPDLGAVETQTGESQLTTGEKRFTLAIVLTEQQVRDGIAYWLGNQWYAQAGVTQDIFVIATRKQFIDPQGAKHYRVYFGVRKPPLIKRPPVKPIAVPTP